jgi:phage shock protein PspC (stress-responsive transcriptional regulator)
MKEITRIHIAKIAYEIEINAKKALEKYLNSLKVYANDTELLDDIEIRITELLAERGVVKDGVITMADIEAIEKQLGEPRDFMDGDDVPAGASESLGEEPVRQLYRNTDNAVLGGVFSGIASYFKIDPLWLRLAAIVLFFASSGVALLIYIALCFAIPPARTAAEKLRMSGRPVTLASLREMGDDSVTREASRRRAQTLHRIVARSVGVLSILGALIALGVTVAVVFHTVFRTPGILDTAYSIISFSLAVVAGVLLTLLFILAAYCAFTQKVTKRLLIIGAVIIVLGLGAAGSAAGTIWFYEGQARQAAVRDAKTTTTSLPLDFKMVKTLKINAPGVRTQYRVSSDAPKIVLMSLSNLNTKYTIDGTTATISLADNANKNERNTYMMPPTLTIYGPALDDLELENGAVSYDANNQVALNVHILRDAARSFAGDEFVTISGGVIDKLSIVNESSDWITMAADDGSVRNIDARLRTGDTLRLGKIQNLTVVYPDVCASGTSEASVEVAAVQASTMVINQRTVPTQSMHEACGRVQIGTSSNQ